MIKIIRTDSDNTDFRELVSLLDQDLAKRDGNEHAFYAQYNTLTKIRHTVVAYYDNKPVGCGAIKEYSKDSVEVKRMFVRPEYRGKGIAKRVLSELETWAGELKYTSCVLETGKRQPEAISLYQKEGYEVIPNYGQYENVENSVCMSKTIS